MRSFLSRHSLIASVLICACWIGLFGVFSHRLERASLAEQRDSLEQAVERCITTCYALEGHFPPDLAYLREHYGLSYDESRFYVDYLPQGSNLRPFYIVLEKKDAGGESSLSPEEAFHSGLMGDGSPTKEYPGVYAGAHAGTQKGNTL